MELLMSILRILAIVLMLGVLYVVLRAIYYLHFHPLARVPGPKLYAFSDIPYLYYLVRGEWTDKLRTLHDQYGPVVRFSHNDVAFTSSGAWSQIYGPKRAPQKHFEKDLRIYRPSASGYSSILRADEADHTRMRRILSHAFSDKALRGQQGILLHYTELLMTRLTEMMREGSPVDMVRWLNFTTFDIIGDLAFGEPFGCLDSGGYHPWVAMIFDGMRTAAYSQVFRRHTFLAPLRNFIMPSKATKGYQEHFQLSRQTALRRIQTGKRDREDIMSYILRHNDDKGMSTPEIAENAELIIIAGSETTATVLSGVLFHILRNPQIYDVLVNEIRSSFETEDQIQFPHVNTLEYMAAVLTEGLRMYPPVPIGTARLVPTGGEFVEGCWMPENTSVSISHWAAYQSQLNWHQPQRFAPERWLDDPEFNGDKKDVLNPFSVGPRNCIGKNLAYVEMRLMLARLLWNFDLELLDECKNWYPNQRIFTLWEKGPLNVKLTLSQNGRRA